MHRKLTGSGASVLSVITYSIGPPKSGALCDVNRTPLELIFLVKPARATRSAPERVIESGSCKVKRLVLRCSMVISMLRSDGKTVKGLLSHFGDRIVLDKVA